jgi:protein gp37
MASLLSGKLKQASETKHILWGVSVEDRNHGLPRIDTLRVAKPANLFLSIEPLLEDLGEFDLTGVCWVIVGGESGPGARPMDPEWVRTIHRQCVLAEVPFFFKQWGGTRKKAAGRLLDGRLHDEFPSIEAAQPPTSARRRAMLETAHYESAP